MEQQPNSEPECERNDPNDGVGKWPGDVHNESNEAYRCGEESEVSTCVRCGTRCESSKADDDGPRADDECRFVMNAEDGDCNIFEGARKLVDECEAGSFDDRWRLGVD